MAVLVEAISVVVRREAVERGFLGGWQGFLRGVTNGTFCTDGVLARVGFMSLHDVAAYTSTLEEGGLVFNRNGQAVDFAVVHQLRGPTIPAPWLELGKIETGSVEIAACWPAGGLPGMIALPDGWKHDPALVAGEIMDGELKFLRREDSLDVYLDLRTGNELFAGRPAFAGDTEAVLFTQLEAAFHEALAIEAEMQRSDPSTDPQGLARLSNRLNNELLPAVMHITEGAGREMPFAHFTLGLVLRMLDRREDAEVELRTANALKPGTIYTLRDLVRCLGEQGKHEEALPFAREAVELAPVDAGVWGNLAMCLIQCRQREEARRAIDCAIQLDSEDPINCYIRDNFENYFK